MKCVFIFPDSTSCQDQSHGKCKLCRRVAHLQIKTFFSPYIEKDFIVHISKRLNCSGKMVLIFLPRPHNTIERASIVLNHPIKKIKALQWIKRDNSGLSLNPKKDVQQLVCSKSGHLNQLLYSTEEVFKKKKKKNHHILITIRPPLTSEGLHSLHVHPPLHHFWLLAPIWLHTPHPAYCFF